MIRRELLPLLLALGIALLLCGCISLPSPAAKCTVVLEDNDALYFQRQVWTVTRYDDATVSVGVPAEMRISHVNYDDYSVSAKTGRLKTMIITP